MAAATSSPFSSGSSSRSFYTANASSGDLSTSASSPVQSRPSPYRTTRQLPLELKQHCQILLEEQLYVPAINLLNSALATSASGRQTIPKPVAVPPASHIALLSTLAIHPLYTSRAEKQDQCTVANLSLAYLQSLLEIAGPLNADFRTAFQFNVSPRWTRRGGFNSTGNNSDASDAESDRDDDRLRGKMSNDSSVWNRSRDFCVVVGWAFRCSTLHPNRWQYWRRWLSFVLDVLEKDWDERTRLDHENHEISSRSGEAVKTLREQSIIAQYMKELTGRAGCKTIVKAMLTTGEENAVAFPEIFDREPRGPRKSSNKRKRDAVLDLENDRFGDYFDDESISSGVSEPPTPQKPKDGRARPVAATSNGNVESIQLRLRLFKIISAAMDVLEPDVLGDLYLILACELKNLPLDMFALLITTRSTPLGRISQHALIKDLLRLFINKVPRAIDEDNLLDLEMAKKHLINQAANTSAVEDNAKLSLVIESTLQLLWQDRSSTPGEFANGLAEAAEKGIVARGAKVKRKRSASGKTQRGEGIAQHVLARSSERIRMLVEIMGGS
ncbi:hypothetical protein NLU13_3070 [Sarocladium strictum]|uniref:Uncharacterized protein n=1 Tax=Sarocladium strictum TaxID=5046 RepID=A0AA39LA28_SARSR|nr:hypothetical protein NLU13_3070 [Sarocladium strictum]